MEVIVNPKALEGRHQGVNVIQLETAVGAAMKVNNNSVFIYTQFFSLNPSICAF